MLATNPIDINQRRKLVATFCKALNVCEDLLLIVKLHPSESISDYRNESEMYPDVQFVGRNDASKEKVLSAADIVVCHNTGLGLEAMLWGKPVVVLNAIETPLKGASDWVHSGACPNVTSADELQDVVNQMLDDWSFRQRVLEDSNAYLRRVYAATGQTAARWAADIICRDKKEVLADRV